jgi:hypothetical protein
LLLLVIAPSGKPTTEQTRTLVPCSFFATYDTQEELTHTDLNWYSIASLQSLSNSSALDSGFNNVWSIYFAMSRGVVILIFAAAIFIASSFAVAPSPSLELSIFFKTSFVINSTSEF